MSIILSRIRHIIAMADKNKLRRHRLNWWFQADEIEGESDTPQPSGYYDRIRAKDILIICPDGNTLNEKKGDGDIWKDFLFTDPQLVQGESLYLCISSSPSTACLCPLLGKASPLFVLTRSCATLIYSRLTIFCSTTFGKLLFTSLKKHGHCFGVKSVQTQLISMVNSINCRLIIFIELGFIHRQKRIYIKIINQNRVYIVYCCVVY